MDWVKTSDQVPKTGQRALIRYNIPDGKNIVQVSTEGEYLGIDNLFDTDDGIKAASHWKRKMNRRPWTSEEIKILQEQYHNHTGQELADMLERPISSIYFKAGALGLKTDPEFIREVGRRSSEHPNVKATQFRPGSVPQNKGKKMSAEVYERCKGTMFKAGNRPKTALPVGTEIWKDDGYLWRKIAEPNKWKQVHRILWEENHGPIPNGHICSFKNKNRKDIRLENLYLTTRERQLRDENSMEARYPEDLRSVIRMKGAIKRRITMINRMNNEEHKS